MGKRTNRMIILKTVCDVPDKDGRQLFGRLICGEPAIGVGGLLVSVMFGKDGVHVCARHASLPLERLIDLFQRDKEIKPIDDSQR